MNILITSAGRRASLLKFFKAEAHARSGCVFAGDVSSLAPTLFLADQAVPLPPVSSPEYIPALEGLVRRQHIRLIVPTIDTELRVLACNASRLAQAGAYALVSDATLIDCTRDKWRTHIEFTARGFRMPRTWRPEDLEQAGLPDQLFLKPRDGSASQHTHAVDRGELHAVLPRVPFPIIQERVDGREITIDALLGLDGEPLHYVPRIRLKAIGGESVQGVTIDDTGFKTWMRRLLDALRMLGGRGPMTIQAFLVDDGEPVLFEINPRFGGGFPLGHAAGGRYPEWICRMLDGQGVLPRLGDYARQVYMTRYYEEIITRNLPWPA